MQAILFDTQIQLLIKPQCCAYVLNLSQKYIVFTFVMLGLIYVLSSYDDIGIVCLRGFLWKYSSRGEKYLQAGFAFLRRLLKSI